MQLVREVAANELRSLKQDLPHWTYVQREEEPGKQEVKRVVQTSEGPLYMTLSRSGQPLTPEQQRDEEQHVQTLIHDPEARKKELATREHDIEKARQLLTLLPEAFLFSFAGGKGRYVRVTFRPNPDFHPPTREARVLHAMEGILLIDAKERRLAELKGELSKDVEFGGGILGSIKKGGSFDLQQSEIAPGQWQLTLLDVHIHGKALLFKTITQRQHEIRSHFRRVPDNLTTAQAAGILRARVAAAALY